MAHSTWIPDNKSVSSVVINGEKYTVGFGNIEEIVYHTPCGEGDRHFVDIVSCGEVVRVFNIEDVSWEEDKQNDD